MKYNYTETAPGRYHEYVDVFLWKPAKYKTLRELIETEFADFEISPFYKEESFPVDGDISHGYEIAIVDNSDRSYGVDVNIYPYIEWSDGLFKPCHGWGFKYSIGLEKR